MAELGIVGLVVQIADVGLRLSLKLYTFGETVASADRTILSISKDISLTSSVLQELGHNLEKDKKARICSDKAVKTAEEVVQECLKVFQEIEGLLEKNTSKIGLDGQTKAKWTSTMKEKLKWPFLQPKMQLLRSNLDKLKATLLLMLNVMTYARLLSESKNPDRQLEDHRRLIEDLARSKDEYTRKFEALTLAIEARSPVHGAEAPQNLNIAFDLQNFSSRSPSPFQQGQADQVLNELSLYGKLINRLLIAVNAAEQHMEPSLGSRIRDDLIGTHKRESSRFRTLHGRRRLRKTLTGLAWDMIKTEFEAEPSSPSTTEQELTKEQSDSRVELGSTQAGRPSGVEKPEGNISHLNHHWVPPLGFWESVDATEIGNELSIPVAESAREDVTSPHLPPSHGRSSLNRYIHGQSPSRSGRVQREASNTARRPFCNPFASDIESGTQIDTVPPPHSNVRSKSPAEVRSLVHSGASSGSEAGTTFSSPVPPDADEDTMMSRSQDASSLAYDFDVKEQDRSLPVANVARIMRGALPEHAKVAREARECMQECVSEFVSFITSEAAEKCRRERRKTVAGQDVLFAMTALGFENYAAALKLYLGGRLQPAGAGGYSVVERDQAVPNTGHDHDGPIGTVEDFYTGPTGKEIQAVERNAENYRNNEEDAGTEAGNVVNALLSQWTTVAVSAV